MANKETGWYCRHKASIVETTNTSVKIKVECFWQNDGWYYQINNVSAWVYCNGEAVKVKNAGSINTTSNSQSVSCGSATFTISKSTSAKSISCYAKITSNSSYVSGTKSSSSTNVSVPAKPSYKVAYNANGGSGAPGSQTKWYGTNLTLSSTKPTRTGYKFQGWGTSASDTTVDYAAGATYSANAAITLYAIWKANTYTVSYNANGGSGAPGSQTKTYGVNLTLSSTKPTRTNYNFKGWGTSASSTSVAYAAGATYKGNASITLYAIWELAYTKPRITNASVKRCYSGGTASSAGTYIGVTFSWATDKTVSAIELYYKKSTVSSWSSATTVSASGTSGTVSNYVIGGGSITTESTYDVLIRVKDASGQTDTALPISSTILPIDVRNGGNGVAIGKVAETANLFDVNWNAKFRGTVEADKLLRRGAIVGQSSSTTTNPYYKFASISISSKYTDASITFKVSACFNDSSKKVGILTAHCRTNGNGQWEGGKLVWEYACSGVSTSDFIMAHNSSASPTIVELWVKCSTMYQAIHFDVISEGSRVDRTNHWTLYSLISAGSQSAITSGYTQIASALAPINGLILPNESGLSQPSGRLMGTFTDGTLGHIASISPSDNIALGYGSYNSKKGNTNIYGYDINFNISNLAENTQYKPYFSRGDTLDVNIYTGGYITSGSTSLYFTIPLAKPIIGAPTISISSLDGFRLRQNNNYTHGSSSNGFCKPSSFSVTRYANLGLCVVATFSNVTNAVNNAPIGIDFNGRITFS